MNECWFNLRRGLSRLFASLIICLAISAPPVTAQEPVLDEGGRKLVLQKIPDIETGIASLISGSVGPEGEKFFIENLTMFQPAMVVLIAAEVEMPLKLDLAKFRYDETAWSGDTGEEGTVSHQFRTQGEVKIHVQPVNAEPGSKTPFYMIAWAAELPGPSDMPPPVEVVSSSGSSGGGIPGWMKIGGGILAVAVIAAVFFRLGRKS
jgi:hypothetical protein